jgi:hypothetical protein
MLVLHFGSMPVWSELLALSSGAWRLSVLALLVLATGCYGWPEGVTATSPSRISSRLSCGLVFSGQGSKIFLSRHGDVEESMLGVLGCRLRSAAGKLGSFLLEGISGGPVLAAAFYGHRATPLSFVAGVSPADADLQPPGCRAKAEAF